MTFTHSIEFFSEFEHLVHVDIHRQVIMGNSLFRLHQSLGDHLQTGNGITGEQV